MYAGYGLTDFSKRFGTGAFDYDFGALDEKDNELTKSYMNVMYGRPRWTFAVPVPLITSSLFSSFMSFGVPSRLFIFLMCVAGWFPGLLPWLCDNSNDPGMKNLRWNKVSAHTVARELVDSKRQELKAGTPRKDLMSMLGSLLSSFALVYAVIDGRSLPQSKPTMPSARA